jgi:hypothetical protein
MTNLCEIYKDKYGNKYEVIEIIEIGRSLEDTLVRFKIIESQSIYAPEGKTFVVSEDRLINQEYIKDESV